MVCIHVYSMAPSITVQYREQKGPFLDKDDSCESSLAISNNYNYCCMVGWYPIPG